ncbi:MAG: phenylalanine--tRNA ligase subunit alpha [Dehalococcoidia bacterium]
MLTDNLNLDELAREAQAALAAATDEAALEQFRLRFLSRGQGQITALLRGIKDLPNEEKPRAGAAINRLHQEIEAAFEARRAELRERSLVERLEREQIDVTLPGRARPLGRLHPVTQTLRRILAIFGELGFRVAEGPEVEWDRYNFEMLRIPADHPARDMWDTMWVEGAQPILLRTHTSPNQVRLMQQQPPPVRVAVPGRVYRYEATDATHEWMLHQVELLAVDEGITLADLKGTLDYFAKRLLGAERRTRMNHSYFPFVEPGVEMAVDCFICNGKGCGTCKGTGWIEILGAGMVHPEVLAGVGYDPERYTGFAAGMGVERLAMPLYGVSDIRHFFQNDLRFLEQF